MRIALTIPYLPPYVFDGSGERKIYGKVTVGGAETWGWGVARALQRAGQEVCVFTADLPMFGQGWSLVEGIPVFRSRTTEVLDLVPVFGADYLNALTHDDFDIYHFALFCHRNFYDMVQLAKQRGKVSIFSHHGCGITAPDAEERRRFTQALAEVDAITVPSDSSFCHYQNKYIQRRIVVVPNGIDTHTFRPGAWSAHAETRRSFRARYFGGDDRPVVLFVGRLLPHKGLLFLLEATVLLRQILPPSQWPRVVIAGTGDQEDELLAACQSHGLGVGEDIVFSGFVPENLLPAYYSAADIFTLPSTRKGYHGEVFTEPESFGIVLAEAMACGTPCVAHDIPGVNSVVTAGVNGLLAEEGSAASLAACLAQLIAHPELRQQYGRHGVYTARQLFERDGVAQKLVQLYQHSMLLRRRALSAPVPQRPTVIFFAPSTTQFYSGQGQHLFEVSRRLIEQFDIEIVTDNCVAGNLAPLREFVAAYPIRLSVLDGYAAELDLDPRVPQMGDHIARLSPHTVLCMVGWASSWMGDTVLRHRAGRPLAFVPHYQPDWTVPIPAHVRDRIRTVLTEMLRQSELVFADSEEEKTLLASQTSGQVLRAFLGVDPIAFRYLPVKKEPIVLFVGDLKEPRKRVDLVLRVFGQMKARYPAFRLAIIGRCEEPAAIFDLVPEHLREAVDLLGYVSELKLMEYYARAQIFINTASYEAFCIPLIEAMATGTIPLATRTGGVPSVIEHGVTGFLLDPEHPEQSLEDVWHVLDDPGLCRAMTWAMRCRVREVFNWDVCAETVAQGFRTLLASRSPSPAPVPLQAARWVTGKRRVLMVNDYYTPEVVGGAEVYLQLLTEHLPPEWDVTVLRHGLRAQEEQQGRVKVLSRCYHERDGLDAELDNYDLVHVNSCHRLHAAHYARFPQGRTIIDVHDYWPVCPNNELVYAPDLPEITRCGIVYDARTPDPCVTCFGTDAISRMAMRDCLLARTNFLLCHSDYVARQLQRRYATKQIRRVYYGICSADFSVKPRRLDGAQPFRILFIGRISLTKGVTLFKDIVRLLRRDMDDFELVIAGNFLSFLDWYQLFVAEARRSELHQYLRFVGHVPTRATPALFALADVCIVPSLWDEPFGIIAIESMAAGKPVIASRRGGLGEIFEHGVHSLYVDEPSAEAFAAAILSLYREPQKRRALGEAGRHLVTQKYDVQVMIRDTVKCYEEVIRHT